MADAYIRHITELSRMILVDMKVRASQAPQVIWQFRGYLALQRPVVLKDIADLTVEGLEWEPHSEAGIVHAVSIRASNFPPAFTQWLVGMAQIGQVRFVEFGMRGYAEFANGGEWLPWQRGQLLTFENLAHLVWENGVRYQISGPLPDRRLS